MKDDIAHCFDNKGTLLLTIENAYSARISEGYITYSYEYYDEEHNWTLNRLGIYDINKKKNLPVEKIPYPAGIYLFMGESPALDWSAERVTGVKDGKFYVTWNPGYDWWRSRISQIDVDTLEVNEIYADRWCVLRDLNGGYGAITANCFSGHWIGLLSEDGTKEYRADLFELMELCGIPEEVGCSYSPKGYYTNGGWYYNLGEQVVAQLTTDDETKYLLLDFSKAKQEKREARGSYGEASYEMVSNLDDVVVAQYDYIVLSPTGNYLAAMGDDWFYINAKGKIVADYEDCSDFVGNYAMVLEDDGLAYVVDKKFNKLSEGYPADSVFGAKEALGFSKDGKTTLLYVTK
ncbi:MAG: hypothetical protein IJZ55_13855 [Lachnospiraceae bacterium]|nr:hypothetical protein [Lachnospiraceae bacterium]